MGGTDQMKDPDMFALSWDALVVSTLDQARQAETNASLSSTDIFPSVTTSFEIKRVSFAEFAAYKPDSAHASHG